MKTDYAKLTGSDVMKYQRHKIKADLKNAFFNVLILMTLPVYLTYRLVKWFKK